MLVAASFLGRVYCVLRCHSTDIPHTHNIAGSFTHLDASETVQPTHCRNAVFASSNTRHMKDVAPNQKQGGKTHEQVPRLKEGSIGIFHHPWPPESCPFRVLKVWKCQFRCLLKIIVYTDCWGFLSLDCKLPLFLFWILFSWEGVIKMNTPMLKVTHS